MIREVYGRIIQNDAEIEKTISDLGGDMTKAVYDTDNDGIVDNSEALNSQAGSYYTNADNMASGTLTGARGGTGVANTGKTITLGGNLTISGANALTLTTSGTTNVTLPTTGTLATLAGSETFTNKTFNGSNNTVSNIAQSSVANLTTDLANKQTLDSDLTAIAGLSPSNDDVIQRKAGAWTNRSLSQLTTDIDALGHYATLTGTEVLQNKTIDASNNTLSGFTRSIQNFSANSINPADSTTYYFGSFPFLSATTTAGQRRIYFPAACTITSAIVAFYAGTGGTSENVTVAIRKNGTTDTNITTTLQITTTNGYSTASGTGLGISISAGDYIEFKITCPAWATNPATVYPTATIETQ